MLSAAMRFVMRGHGQSKRFKFKCKKTNTTLAHYTIQAGSCQVQVQENKHHISSSSLHNTKFKFKHTWTNSSSVGLAAEPDKAVPESATASPAPDENNKGSNLIEEIRRDLPNELHDWSNKIIGTSTQTGNLNKLYESGLAIVRGLAERSPGSVLSPNAGLVVMTTPSPSLRPLGTGQCMGPQVPLASRYL
jgi:hypothetical protein